MLLQIVGEFYRFTIWQQQYQDAYFLEPRQQFIELLLWWLYHWLPFLLLILFGTLFARKYRGLSFLLLLGYLLPTIVFGRYGQWTDALPFYLVSSVVLIYRFAVALVAPVWLVRVASVPRRQRAAAIPVAVAILCQLTINIALYLTWARQYPFQANFLNFASTIWDQFILAAGLLLAVTLYLPKEQDQAMIAPPAPASAAE